MSSRKNSSQPEIAPAAESLPVPPALAALFAAHGVTSSEPRRTDEFSVEQYAAYRGISTGSANAELLKMERSGRVTRRLMMRQYIYRFADGAGKAP